MKVDYKLCIHDEHQKFGMNDTSFVLFVGCKSKLMSFVMNYRR